jgi:phage portal protein BeeE
MLTKITERIRAGYRAERAAGRKAFASSVTSGGDIGWTQIGGMGTFGRLLSGSTYNYHQEAGKRYDNSIVLACIKWQGRVFPEAPPVVQRRNAEGQWELLPSDLPDLLEEPNPWYDGCTLLQATLLSLAVDGNAYWWKLRSAAGRVVGWQYIPHFKIAPFHAKGDPNPLSGFLYRSGGQEQRFAPDAVLHFRDGMDPENELCGLSPLGAVLREICTDNEASTFTAALLRNMGVPGVVVSPKSGEGMQQEALDPIFINSFKRQWSENFTGENRGMPFVNGIPIDVTNPAFSPEQLVLEKVTGISEERITSVLGIPAVVVGLGAGLDAAGDRNLEAMERWAWRHNVIPTQRIFANHLTTDFRREGLIGKGERVAYDTSAVKALQEDETPKYQRQTAAVGGPWLTANEARVMIGLEPLGPEFDTLYPVQGSSTPSDGDDDGAIQENEPKKAALYGAAEFAARQAARRARLATERAL